jgi:hypothetical protein
MKNNLIVNEGTFCYLMLQHFVNRIQLFFLVIDVQA